MTQDMTHSLQQLNSIPEHDFLALFRNCVHADSVCANVAKARPFANVQELRDVALREFDIAGKEDMLQAFVAHPDLGARPSEGSASEKEQARVLKDTELLQELRQRNKEYREKFGFGFLLCATGKSAQDVLQEIENRMGNESLKEFDAAKEELKKIMLLRIQKLVEKESGAM